MQNKTMQYGLTLKCIVCKCQKRVLPGQVPIGNCDYCFKGFGWVEFRFTFRLTHKPFQEILKDGDIITVNTRIPLESGRRIYEIQRGSVIIYTDPLGDK
jgi:hypothetical protein